MKNQTNSIDTPLVLTAIPLNKVAAVIDTLDSEHRTKHVFNPLIKPLESKTDSHYVASFDYTSDPIGYMHIYFPSQEYILWIQTLVIKDGFLRQGYGTTFFNALLEVVSRQSPLYTVYLTCHDENTVGRHFWESLGFIQRTNFSKQFSSDNEQNHIILYEKILSSSKEKL